METWLLYLAVSLLGLVVGSFLNVVILRLPVMLERSWSNQCRELLDLEPPDVASPELGLHAPPSRCPRCEQRIKPWHNIPVLSYLLLKGRCAYCSQPIGIRYPLVELGGAAIALILAWQFGPTAQLCLALLFGWTLLALTGIDIDHQLLPDGITVPLMWAGLIANAFGLFTDIHSAVFGAAAGYLSLWLVFHLFRLVTGKEGMGHGDFKLIACIGAWLGWQMLPLVILLASAVGAITGIVLIVVGGRERSRPIPFGPFLCAAALIAMLWGADITSAYLRHAGL